MQRYDLRKLGPDFSSRMIEIANSTRDGEVSIFLFEIGDFTPVISSAKILKDAGFDLLNSLKFNDVDWMVTVRKGVLNA